MLHPEASRARLPDVYGLPADSRLIDWADVDARLAIALHYWIATVGPDGEPLARPIDGMWLDEGLYFGGHPSTQWQRNLRANPRVSINLDDTDHAVILRGDVSIIRADPDLAARLADASNAKYAMGLDAEIYLVRETSLFRPTEAVAWNALHEDATRFTFVT